MKPALTCETSDARDLLRLFFADSPPIVEYGAAAAPLGAEDGTRSDGVVFGLGEALGRTCVAVSCRPEPEDRIIGQRGFAEMIRAAGIAAQNRVPLVLLMEGGGYPVHELPYCAQGRDLTSTLAEVKELVPVVGVALGEVRGACGLALGLAHVVVATSDATISLSEEPAPTVDADATEASPTSPLARQGAADLVVDDLDGAIRVVQQWIHLLQTHQVDTSDAEHADDARRLEKLVAGNSRRAIDGRRLTDLILDRGTELRLRERFGGAIQTTIGRLGGRSVGVAASHSLVNAAAIDADAAAKLGDFIEFCDVFGLPVIYLTDVPGLMAGPPAERTAVNRQSLRPYNAQVRSAGPHVTVVVRRGFGQGLVVMGGGHHIPGSVLKLAWPTGQFGVMGNMGAATIRSTSSSASTERVSAEDAHAELVERGTAARAAMDFSMDELIPPAATRQHLIRLLDRLPVRRTREGRMTGDE